MANLFGKITNIVIKNAPAILAGIGIGTMAECIYHTAKTGPKYKKNVEAKKEAKKAAGLDETLTKTEKVQVIAKTYWKTGVMFTVGATCVIASVCISEKRAAALATALLIANKKNDAIVSAVKERFGEGKFEEMMHDIHEDIVKDRSGKPVKSDTVKFPENIPGKVVNPETGVSEEFDADSVPNMYPNVYHMPQFAGMSLCMDDWTGRVFYSNVNQIQAAVNELQRRFIDENDAFISLNALYERIPGLGRTDAGDDMGWLSTGDPITVDLDPIVDEAKGNQVILHMSPVGVGYRYAPYDMF